MGNSKSNHLGAQGTVNPEPCYVLLQAPAEPDRNALLRMWVQRFGFALHTTPRQGGTQRYAGKLTSGEPSPEVSRRMYPQRSRSSAPDQTPHQYYIGLAVGRDIDTYL